MIGRIALAGAAILMGCAPPHPPGATETERFDAWFASSGVTITHQTPVPCLGPTDPGCGATGRYIAATKAIYIDDVLVAQQQAATDATRPGINVALQVLRHEQSHAAFFAIGEHLNPNPGDIPTTLIWWEREAQCGMRLLMGRGWTPPGADPTVYWICPDAKVAETRWIWAKHGVI